MQSRLSLAFPDSNSVEHILVVDTSFYNENIPVQGQALSVLVPGRSEPVEKTFKQKNFFTVLNSSALGLTKRGQQGVLPDGIYQFDYSIAPNNKIWVTYYYVKLDSIKERLNRKRCSQLSGDISKKLQGENLKKLDYIEQLIKASKSEAEILANKERSVLLYQEADKLLDRLENNCQTC